MLKPITIGAAVICISVSSTYLFNRWLQPSLADLPQTESSTSSKTERLNARLASAEQRINWLQEQLEQSKQPLGAQPPANAVNSTPQNQPSKGNEPNDINQDDLLEIANREFADNKIKEIEAFESEAIDFNWSLTAESNLENALHEKANLTGFQILSSECKTTRCKAVVEFSNYDSAIQNGTQLAEAVIPNLNCMQSIYMPEPSDVSAKYQAELMLNCASQ